MKGSQGGGDIHQLAGYYLHIKAVFLYGHIVILSFVVAGGISLEAVYVLKDDSLDSYFFRWLEQEKQALHFVLFSTCLLMVQFLFVF